MRLPFRAALAAPLAAVLTLVACTGDPVEEGSTTDQQATDDATGDPTDDPTDAATAAPLPDPVDLGDGIAATVGDVEITVEQLNEALAPRGVDADAADIDTVRGLLGQVIQVELVEQAATSQLGVDLEAELTEEAIATRAEEYIEEAGGLESFESIVAQEGIGPEGAQLIARQEARVQVLVEIVRTAVAEDLSPTQFDEEAIRAGFDADPGAYQSSDVAHILLDTEQEALDALARLEDGEEFADLAAELSTGPSGPNGGALGVAPRGSYVQEFQDAVYADTTEVGAVVGPVETEFGFHLILVNDIITPTIDDVVAGERLTAAGPAFQTFVTTSFGATSVVVDDDFGVWDEVTSSVVAPAS